MLPLIHADGFSYLQTLSLNSPKDSDQSARVGENTGDSETCSNQVIIASEISGTSTRADSSMALLIRQKLEDIEIEEELTLIWALKNIESGGDPLQVIQACKFNLSTPKGQKAVIQVAVDYSYKNISHLSEIIDKFGIDTSLPEGKKALIEMAKTAAQYGDNFSKYIKNYGIDPLTSEGQNILIELALVSSKRYHNKGISQYIENYGIDKSIPKGRHALIEIAKLAAEQHGSDIAQYIQNYGLDGSTQEGRQTLFEIAKRSAQKYQTKTPAFMQNFGFDKNTQEGQKKLIFLAKLCSSQLEDLISPYIRNFGIDPHSSEGKRALLEIAKACTITGDRSWDKSCIISQYIQNYGFDNKTLDGQKALIEIAMLSALKNGVGTSQYIKNYSIDPTTTEGKKALIRIAKIAAQQNGGMSQYIQNYGLENFGLEGKKALQEIAKMSAQSNGKDTSQFIANYGFDPATKDGQKILWEIAEMAIQQDPRGASQYIHHYKLEKKTKEWQKALCQYFSLDKNTSDESKAKIELSRNAKDDEFKSSEKNKNLGLDPSYAESLRVFVKDAKKTARNPSGDTRKVIKSQTDLSSRVEPKGKQPLIESALLDAQRTVWSSPTCCEDYGIDKFTREGQEALIKIAKVAAEKQTYYFTPLMKNYGINLNTSEGQAALLDIAWILAKSYSGGALSEYLDDFGINSTTHEGQKNLMELAKTAAAKHGNKFSEYVYNYNIDDTSPEGKAAWFEIAKTAAKDNFYFIEHFIYFPIDASTEEGQLQLIEIAKILVKQNLRSINVQLGIDKGSRVGFQGLLEIVKLGMAKDTAKMACALPLLGLETSEEGKGVLAELAMLAARHEKARSSEDIQLSLSRYIQNFGIDKSTPQGQKLLGEIAKIAASQNGEGTSKYIQNYGIDKATPQGQKLLCEIAIIASSHGDGISKRAASQNGEGISKYIQNYGIDKNSSEGRRTLIEIAKLAMQNSKEDAKYIENYGLDKTIPEDQEALIELALIAAEKHGVAEYIEYFGIDFKKRKNVLIEIALKSAKVDPRGTSEHIQRFLFDPSNDEDRTRLIEIAKVAATKWVRGSVSEFIQNYQIESTSAQGQKSLIEIAELAAKTSHNDTSKYIKNYGIDISKPEGRQGIIRIARMAKNSCFATCDFAQNYELGKLGNEGFQVLAELAKASADQSRGSLIYHWIKNYGFQNYGLKGQKILIEVATLASQKLDGWLIGEHLENFAIDITTPMGQAGLAEIAKNIAKQSGNRTGNGISLLIHKFGFDAASLQGQTYLIEIAKLAAAEDGYLTSKSIANYGIDKKSDLGQAGLIAIAKVAVQNGKRFAIDIQNYGIDGSQATGQRALIEIAKIAAHQPEGVISEYIQHFGIEKNTKEGQHALVEIAKIAARQNGENTSEYIANYGIDAASPRGQQGLFEVAQMAIEQYPLSYSKLSNYKLNTSTESGHNYTLDLYNRAIIFALMKVDWVKLEIMHVIEKFNPESLSLKDESIYSLSLGQPFLDLSKDKIDRLSYLDKGLALCQSHFGLTASDVEWVKKTVAKKKDESNQREFISWFITMATVCCARKDLAVLFKEQKTLWQISKLQPKLREVLTRQFIFMSFNQREPIWRKLKIVSENIPHVELACLFFSLFPQEDPDIFFKAIACLKKEREFKDGNHQMLLLETLLKIKDCSLPPKQKAAVIAMLFGLPVKRRLLAFRQVQDVLNFKAEAFLDNISTPEEISQALENLFRTRIDIRVDQFSEKYEKTLGTWRQPDAIMTYGAKLQELPEQERIKANQLLKEFLSGVLEGTYCQSRYAIEKNPHLAEIADKHPFVYAKWQQSIEMEAAEINHFLKHTDKEPVTQKIVNNLKEALAHNHLGGDVQATCFPELTGYVQNTLSVESALSRVEANLKPLSRRLNEDEKDIKNRLLIEKKLLELLSDSHEMEKKLMELKSHITKEMEFFNDIEGALRMLKKTELQNDNKLTVIDTDDANHILLMGSEVESSCQRVDGSAQLNKCLLGFLLDGKHRLGVVCDSYGKIVARAVFRLLIDSNGQPVLFQEKVYVKGHGVDYALLLRKLAAKKAMHLGIPLVFAKEEGGNTDAVVDYPYSVHAKDKPVPFEYVDADRMGIQSGTYSIGILAQLKL